jgi:hypothetical protein
MDNYKEKYFKYKIKYLQLKNSKNSKNNKNILSGGEHIFDSGKIRQKIDKALGSFRWSSDTILIDCIRDIKTQEKTNKIIQYIFDNDYIEINNHIQLNWSLVYAVKLGLPFVTNKLLSLGADPNFTDQYGMSLVEYAIGEKYKLILSYLIDKKALLVSEEIEKKYNGLINSDYSGDYSGDYIGNYSGEQEDKVDQSIFVSEINMKIYNGIKKILANKKTNLDFDSIDITIE